MDIETRPMPNFHAARIRDPVDFDRIVVLSTTKEGIQIIGGPLKSSPKGPTTAQAYRFPKSKFTAVEAKAWLKDHDIKYKSFESAAGERVIEDDVERRTLDMGLDAHEDMPMMDGAGAMTTKQKHIVGYAAMYNSRTTLFDGMDEQFAPGAFSEYLGNNNNDVCALFNHDPNWVLGRRSAGTLSLAEDDKGLRYDIMLPNTQRCNDLYASIKRGDIRGSSMGFRCAPDGDEFDRSNPRVIVRTVRKAMLRDVSPATFPAYRATNVSVRTANVYRDHFANVDVPPADIPHVQRLLREARLSIIGL